MVVGGSASEGRTGDLEVSEVGGADVESCCTDGSMGIVGARGTEFGGGRRAVKE